MKLFRGFGLLAVLIVTLTTTPTSTARRTTATSSKAAVKAKRLGLPVVATKNKNATVVAMPAWKAGILYRAKVGFYFGLWYALNIVYNSKYDTLVLSCHVSTLVQSNIALGHISHSFSCLAWCILYLLVCALEQR